MHNIDLAVETGPVKQDYELTSEERRAADLANLELSIRQVAEDASSKSQAGGALRQIREFNAFLRGWLGLGGKVGQSIHGMRGQSTLWRWVILNHKSAHLSFSYLFSVI